MGNVQNVFLQNQTIIILQTFQGSEYNFFTVTNKGGTPLWKALLKYVSISPLKLSPEIKFQTLKGFEYTIQFLARIVYIWNFLYNEYFQGA